MRELRFLATIIVGIWCCLVARAETFDNWKSTNTSRNSTSSKTYTLDVTAGDQLTFSWEVSSEEGFDKLIVTLDGTSIIVASGEDSGTYMKEFTSPGTHTLVVKYTKDEDESDGSDCAWISNVKVENPYKGTTSNGLVWSYDKDACKLSISGSGAMDNWTSSTLSSRPWNSYMSSVKHIEIGKGITSVGNYAFYSGQYESKLKNISIPSSVTSIGSYAFCMCEVLPLVVIPEGVKTIGSHAFYYIGARNDKSACVVLPSTLTSIGNYAFYCDNGTEDEPYWIYVYSFAYYPPTIYSNTFCLNDNEVADVYCKNTSTYSNWLDNDTWIITPRQLPSTSGISGNSMYKYESGTLTLYPGDGRVNGGCIYALGDNTKKNIRSVNIFGHATSITNFNEYTELTSIEIPSTVTSVGGFSNCHSLSTIVLPSSVKEIASSTFSFCKNLKTITLSENLKRIGFLAFNGCSSLESLYIPASVDSIEYGITSRASALKTIVVDENNKAYNSRENCNAIIKTSTNSLIAGCQTSSVPSGIVCIEDDAFSGQTELTHIEIPSSVTAIKYGAFRNCSNLKSVLLQPNTYITTLEDYAFAGVASDMIVYVNNSGFNAGNTSNLTFRSYQDFIIPDAGITTYFGYGWKIPEGMKAYYVSGVDHNMDELIISQITDEFPTNTGVILMAEPGTYRFFQANNPQEINNNLLYGTSESKYVEWVDKREGTYYILSEVDGEAIFYRAELSEDGLFYNNAGNAFLFLEGANSNIKSFSINFNDDETTEIDFIVKGNTPNIIYNVHGQRVSSITTSGLYIVNGKKILIK